MEPDLPRPSPDRPQRCEPAPIREIRPGDHDVRRPDRIDAVARIDLRPLGGRVEERCIGLLEQRAGIRFQDPGRPLASPELLDLVGHHVRRRDRRKCMRQTNCPCHLVIFSEPSTRKRNKQIGRPEEPHDQEENRRRLREVLPHKDWALTPLLSFTQNTHFDTVSRACANRQVRPKELRALTLKSISDRAWNHESKEPDSTNQSRCRLPIQAARVGATISRRACDIDSGRN
jgi:hypothetical protein